MTPRQLKEKECLEWFSPRLFVSYPPKEGDFESYLAHSERGVPIVGFNVYSEAKRWRGITVHELWESGFEYVGLRELLLEENSSLISEHIMRYIAREICAGKRKQEIEDLYLSLQSVSLG